MEIKVSTEYIGEYEGVHMIWVSWGSGGKMLQLTEEDLKKYEEGDEFFEDS